MGNIIELKGIRKSYDGNVNIVEDINLEIGKGEFVTLLGPSGCGKTTTLRMIAGFEIPTEGEILLNGKDISDLPPRLQEELLACGSVYGAVRSFGKTGLRIRRIHDGVRPDKRDIISDDLE